MKLLLITVLIIAISFIFFSVRVLLKKDGEFPNTHIDGSVEMKKRGIHCVLKQDRELRNKNK